MQKGRINIVFGGQCGSESKGKQASYLADKFDIMYFAGCLSPNAGHTVIKDGIKVVTHHIPVGVVECRNIKDAIVMIGPAAVINVEKFVEELGMLNKMGLQNMNVYVDERVGIITPDHIKSEENTMTVIGSTAQGVGEARVDKIMRRGVRAEDTILNDMGLMVASAGAIMRTMLDVGCTILYEMGQGFDLCVDHGVDPVYCTSRNCTPQQALADMGIPTKYLGDVYAVIRPYPIRVNNRDGSSGPYPSKEVTWEEVKERCGANVDITEYTTTTKLKRRVFEFSEGQIKRMVDVCNPDYLCLQFANYIDHSIYGRNIMSHFLFPKVIRFVSMVEKVTGKRIAYLGTGPDHNEMIDLNIDNWR